MKLWEAVQEAAKDWVHCAASEAVRLGGYWPCGALATPESMAIRTWSEVNCPTCLKVVNEAYPNGLASLYLRELEKKTRAP